MFAVSLRRALTRRGASCRAQRVGGGNGQSMTGTTRSRDVDLRVVGIGNALLDVIVPVPDGLPFSSLHFKSGRLNLLMVLISVSLLYLNHS